MPKTLMRTLAFVVLATLTAVGVGCDAPQRATRARLKVGDPAPPLTAVTWLNGGGSDKFEPGKITVLEFWATWCGPCVEAMPHLGELQKKYAKDGVVIVPVTNADADQSELDVEKYARRHGPDYGLVFALCGNRDTKKAYVDAGGLQGIPQSFVVDRQGKIAFIGRPYDLDDVLPGIVAAK